MWKEKHHKTRNAGRRNTVRGEMQEEEKENCSNKENKQLAIKT
jgi:hypothetical protein